jgi:hypothetical protein
VDASQREKEILERQAEEQQSARRVLEVQHMALYNGPRKSDSK